MIYFIFAITSYDVDRMARLVFSIHVPTSKIPWLALLRVSTPDDWTPNANPSLPLLLQVSTLYPPMYKL